MQQIELTKEHKSKLLEMCKALFPECREHLLSDQHGRCRMYQNGIDKLEYVFFIGELGGESLKIHWFEFCMTYLVDKIYYPDGSGKRGTRSKVEYFFFQSFINSIEGVESGYDHPVDYLYDEFKKLKI